MKRIMIAGTHSGSGKTTVTCAVLQALVNRKMNVTSFKCGPDYIDPMFHSKIIGAKSRNLDSFFCDTNTVNYLLHKNSGDISVIEGVMGFYDGVGKSASSHTLSIDTKTPVILVIDCKGISLSMGAVMKGFLTFEQHNNIVGFIFNRLHESLIETAKNLCSEMNVKYFGRMPYCRDCSVESRHLGLVTANEISDLKEKMNRLGELAEENLLIDELISYAEKAEDTDFKEVAFKAVSDVRIAVAYDNAFCFYYEDNLDLLRELGCEIVKFSPLSDSHLPDNISGLIIGGGYPELYADKLSENKSLLSEIREKISGGMPTIAECGGFMYLHKELENADGKSFGGVGVIGGNAYKTSKLQRFGYVCLTAENDNLLCGKGEKTLAHEFHYWDSTACGNGFSARKTSNGFTYECCHSGENIYAGFPHLYFYANPEIAVNFAEKCQEYQNLFS
jgi:cobyrinic acid a,c-diamide synthase